MACKVVQRRIKKLGVRWVKECGGVIKGFAKAPRGKKSKKARKRGKKGRR